MLTEISIFKMIKSILFKTRKCTRCTGMVVHNFFQRVVYIFRVFNKTSNTFKIFCHERHLPNFEKWKDQSRTTSKWYSS